MNRTIGDIEKESGVKFGVNPRMKLSTWFRRNGLPSLGTVLDTVEKMDKALTKSPNKGGRE